MEVFDMNQKIYFDKNMKIEKVSIDSIKVYPNNAKIHTAEQIEEIKNNALRTANELFTPDEYIERFNDFLNKCK